MQQESNQACKTASISCKTASISSSHHELFHQQVGDNRAPSFETHPSLILSFFLSSFSFALLLEAPAVLATWQRWRFSCLYTLLSPLRMSAPPSYPSKVNTYTYAFRWPGRPGDRAFRWRVSISPRGLANYTRSRLCTPLCVATTFRVHLFTKRLAHVEHAHWSHAQLATARQYP